MPRSKLKGRDVLRALLNVGATAVEEFGESRKVSEKQAKIKAFTDFFGELRANPLNTPLGLPQNMGVVQEFPQVQAVKDADLLNRYRILGVTPPDWLQARAKRVSTPPKGLTATERLTRRKARKELGEIPLSPIEQELQDLALRGKRATVTKAERLARGEKTPTQIAATVEKRKKERITQRQKTREQLEKDQGAWDKQVTSYVSKNIEQFPLHAQLETEMAEGIQGGSRERILKSWSAEDRFSYTREKIRLDNILGVRPTKPIRAIRPKVTNRSEGVVTSDDPRIIAGQAKGWVK